MHREKLFILDGSAYCYRAYYAISGLTTSFGQPTGAIYGFVNMLNKLIKEDKPDYLAICFDIKGKTIRHERFEKYKIHRKPIPDELIGQIEAIKDVVRAYHIPIFEKSGYEADDVIASLVTLLADKGLDIYIVSGDKDMLQLVDKHVVIYNPHHKEKTLYNLAAIRERFKVEPAQIVDIMALTGDTADNIPGVPGIGEKTAVDLISRYQTLDNLFREIDDVSSRSKKELLRQYADQARLSRELSLICRDLPIELDLDELRLKDPDYPQLRELYRKWEFNSLIKNLPSKEGKAAPVLREDVLLTAPREAERLLAILEREKIFSFDLLSQTADSCKISFYSPTSGLFSVLIDDKKNPAYAQIKKIFLDPSPKKVCYDAKAMYKQLNHIGMELGGEVFDILIAAYLLDPSRSHDSPEDIREGFLAEAKAGDSRAELVFVLKKGLSAKLQEQNMLDLFKRVEMPLAKILAGIEMKGISVDKGSLQHLARELEQKISSCRAEGFRLAGREFNLNSPKQLGEVLFGELKMPVVKRTKTGFSTNEEVLRKLAKSHPLPRLILEYRELAKLKSTYVDSMLGLVSPHTGRVHTSFNQTVTATGRLSSSEPNLQNIPIRTELGRKVRKVFVAAKDNWSLVSADYSQIELRILAHLSADKNMLTAFQQDEDIHCYTASLIFGVSEDAVTPEMRDTAKRINFGIVYGMGPFGLSKDLEISLEKATDFIDQYFLRYPGVREFIDQQIALARQQGYVTTIMQRRRYIPDINSRDNGVRGFSERIAVNTPIQGSAADMIKLAMVNISRRSLEKNLPLYMLLQVHDELVFETANKHLAEAVGLIRQEMEGIMELTVPLKVSIKAGKNWLEMDGVESRE